MANGNGNGNGNGRIARIIDVLLVGAISAGISGYVGVKVGVAELAGDVKEAKAEIRWLEARITNVNEIDRETRQDLRALGVKVDNLHFRTRR